MKPLDKMVQANIKEALDLWDELTSPVKARLKKDKWIIADDRAQELASKGKTILGKD